MSNLLLKSRKIKRKNIETSKIPSYLFTTRSDVDLLFFFKVKHSITSEERETVKEN